LAEKLFVAKDGFRKKSPFHIVSEWLNGNELRKRENTPLKIFLSQKNSPELTKTGRFKKVKPLNEKT